MKIGKIVLAEEKGMRKIEEKSYTHKYSQQNFWSAPRAIRQ